MGTLFRQQYLWSASTEPNLEDRMTCYELHIGLEHIAYAAFTARQGDLRAVAQRTARVLERDLG